MGNLGFDATQVAPNTAFDPLPAGVYRMMITGADLVDSDKAGQMLKLTHEVDANYHPEFANRKVFSNLCLHHPNDQPRNIARSTLSQICHAIGKMQIDDTSDLIGAVLMVKLAVQPANPEKGYDAGNNVRGYKPIDDGAVAAPASAAPKPTTPTAAPAATAPATAPWKR